MLRGLTTITYFADDVAAAATWYAEVLGVQPYFDRLPAYTEFRIGDHQHELGILDRRHAPHDTTGPGGVITYWAVDDLNACYARLLQLGATTHEKPTERGPGFVTAAVLDPFGNILGIMANQHYLDMLAR